MHVGGARKVVWKVSDWQVDMWKYKDGCVPSVGVWLRATGDCRAVWFCDCMVVCGCVVPCDCVCLCSCTGCDSACVCVAVCCVVLCCLSCVRIFVHVFASIGPKHSHTPTHTHTHTRTHLQKERERVSLRSFTDCCDYCSWMKKKRENMPLLGAHTHTRVNTRSHTTRTYIHTTYASTHHTCTIQRSALHAHTRWLPPTCFNEENTWKTNLLKSVR